MELNWGFMLLLQVVCGHVALSVQGSIKNNLMRMSQNIKENLIEKDGNAFRISDLCRATITVSEPNVMEQVYKILDN